MNETKASCPHCTESYFSPGMLRAHVAYVHEKLPKNVQREVVELALRKEFETDMIRISDQIDQSDLTELHNA